jgi:hypothetical protein
VSHSLRTAVTLLFSVRLDSNTLIHSRRKSDPDLSFSTPQSFAVKILPALHSEGLGGAFVVQDFKSAKKPYFEPTFKILDPSAALAKLATVDSPNDIIVQKMLSVSKEQLEKQKSVRPSFTISLSSR